MNAAALIGANPFPGLRPFRPDEADRFFGRRQQIDELLALLGTRRLIGVAGASGSGKSSLVLAGLLNALQQRHAAGDDDTEWRAAVMRPGGRPIAHLAAALALALDGPTADEVERERRVGSLYGQLRLGGLGLVEAVRRARLPEDAQVLVVVDQFEEIFRFSHVGDAATAPDEPAAFVKLLLQAAADLDAPLRIILTLRSDTLGSCAEFRDLPEAVSRGQYLVPRLKREQRKEAIVRPVALRGAQIAPRLVQRLLNDVSEDYDDLPVMQHALARTWSRWASACQGTRPIDIEDYDAVGGAAMALSNHADEAADEAARAPGGSARVVEQVFRALTERLAEGAEVRRPLAFDTLVAVCGGDAAAVTAVVERFRRADTAFLMPAAEVPLAANPVIDISHESLIRQWQRLRGWVTAEATAKTELLRLIGEAGRRDQEDGNLWRGRNLERALEWQAATRPNAGWVGLCTGGDGDAQWKSASQFLADSQAAVRREIRRERTRVWSLRALVALVLVVSIGAALNNMVKQRESRAGELANQAMLEMARDPARSAHFAAMALEHAPGNRRAEFLLRQAMASLEVAHAERVLHFDAALADIRFDPGRRRMVVAAGREVHLLDAATWSAIGAPLALDGPVRQAWPVGETPWLVTLTEDGQARAHRPAVAGAAAATVVLGCDAKGLRASAVAVSTPKAPGSATVAVGCSDGEVVLRRFAAAGPGERQSLPAGPDPRPKDSITALAFGASGANLAAGTVTGAIRVWRLAAPGQWLSPGRGEAASVANGGTGTITDLGFDRDEQLLAAALDSGTAAVWTLDTAGGRLVSPLVLPHGRPVILARFAQRGDEHNLLTVADRRVFFWLDEHQHEIRLHADTVVDADVSDDGERIASASVDGTVRLWSTRSGTEIAVLAGHRGEVTRVLHGPGGLIATAGVDHSLRLWRVAPPALLAAQRLPIKGAAFDRAGSRVTLCGETDAADAKAVAGSAMCRVVAVTDLSQRGNAEIARLKPMRSVPVLFWGQRVSASADDHYVALDSPDRAAARLWTPPQSESLQAPGIASASAFAADSPVLATLDSVDSEIQLWDSASLADKPRMLARFAGRPGRSLVAVSPDGRWVATNDGPRVALLDRRAPDAAPKVLGEHAGVIRSLAFSRNGARLISAGADRSAKVWPVEGSGAPVVLAGGHSAGLNTAAFNRDGSLVATGSADGSIHIWMTTTGLELAALRRHGDAVTTVAFAPGDDAILSTSDDGTVKLARCAACTTPVAALRQQVQQQIALDRNDLDEFAAMPRPWLPWLQLPKW